MDSNDDPNFGLAAFLAAVIFFAFIIACPLAMIWVFNGLFNMNIPYDFLHWSYAFVLLAIFKIEFSK